MPTDTGGDAAPPSDDTTVTTSPRRRRRRERNRAALLAAARHCFRRKGFVATTISDITEQADVAHGTFYSYFVTKDEVFTEIVDELLDDLLTAVHDVGPEQSIRSRLESGLGALFHRGHEEREIVLALHQASHLHAEYEEKWRLFRDRLRELVSQDLDWLSKRHYTKPMRVDLVAAVIVRMVEGVLLDIVGTPTPDVDGFVTTTVDLYYDAVFRPVSHKDDLIIE